MSLRAEAVKKAKRKGICTQCLKHPAINGRVQCQRCIDTNKRKRKANPEQYAMYQARNYDKHKQTPERKAVIQFCVEHYICTKCMRRPTTSGIFTCEVCRDRNKMVYKVEKPKKKRTKLTEQEKKQRQREYAKKYKHKKLVEKVRKLDRIKHSVEK
jgi:hypothetical protein